MKLSRRKFVLGLSTLSIALISGIGFKYKKKNKLNLFLSNYENIIPLKLNYNKSKQADLFENKIKLMLSSIGIKETIISIDQDIKQDYQSGNLKLFDGWIVSDVEASILELKRKYV
ncbi:hypothetical protein N9327_00255 [Candidatus Pelagibacter sp.]|nr:hypothetical protein [Candidatus Pelagibacter sp.]